VLSVHRLVFNQLCGELVQKLSITNQQVFCGIVGLIDDAPYLLVYLEGDLV
jgi:hypothetical protein